MLTCSHAHMLTCSHAHMLTCSHAHMLTCSHAATAVTRNKGVAWSVAWGVIRQHHLSFPPRTFSTSSLGSLTHVPPSSYPPLTLLLPSHALTHTLPPAGNGVHVSHLPAGNTFPHVLPTRLTFACSLHSLLTPSLARSFCSLASHCSSRSAGHGNLIRFAPTHGTQPLYAEEGLLGGRPAPHGRLGARGADPQSTSLDA